MAHETRKDVIALARLIAEEEEIRRCYARVAPRLKSGVLRARIEKVAREEEAHAGELRRVIGLPAPASTGGERETRPGEGGETTWQALVECVRMEESLAIGYREAAARASEGRLRELLGRLGGEAAAHRNEVSLVAAIVTSFVP